MRGKSGTVGKGHGIFLIPEPSVERNIWRKNTFFPVDPKTHQSHTTQSQLNLKNQNEYDN